MTQPTISVLDSGGVAHTINTTNSNGQAASADSQSVVLASDQTLPLPAGASTDAKLTSIGNTNHADLQALLAKVPSLPTGAASDANLTSIGNTNHIDLQAIATAVNVTNNDLAALLLKTVDGAATDENLTEFANANHTDLAAILAKLVANPATDANASSIGNTLHSDLVALLNKAVPVGGSTDANMTAIGATNHADLLALLAKVPSLPTGASETNRNVTTVANTAVQLMPANANRKYFELQNLSTTAPLYFRKDGNVAAVNGAGTFMLAPGGFYSGQSTGAVSIISTIANHSFSAVEA
jgi:hypothetical protein